MLPRPRFPVVVVGTTLSDLPQVTAGVLFRRRSTVSVNRHGSNRMTRVTSGGGMKTHQSLPYHHHHQQPRIRQLPLSTSVATVPEYSCPSFIIASPSSSLPPQLTSTPIQVPHAAVTTTAPSCFTLHSVVAPTAAAAVPPHHETIPPSDLRALFIASSIPMIGFGFMDQFVLIQAGGYIDATFGIRFGLATLSAAAAGQVVSDVSGVLFGGALERVLTTKTGWLRTPQLTPTQRQLPIGRNVSMLGAVVGVIIGCAIGATSLLLVDLEARNRMERAQRLREILQDMITVATPATTTTATTLDPAFSCDSCKVYVVSTKDLTLPTDHDTSHQWKVQLKDISSSAETSITNDVNDSNDNNDEISLVQQCLASRSIVLSDDRRIMYAPLINRSSPHDIMAIVAFRYGTNVTNHQPVEEEDDDNDRLDETSTATSKCYSDDDILTARVMARHIAIFMDR